MDHFLVAGLGAISQEIAYWYDLRSKVQAQKYRDLIASPAYWGITLSMIAASAVGTVVWFAGEVQSTRTYLLTGAAFPLILKKAISALLARPSRLGAASDMRTYFRAA